MFAETATCTADQPRDFPDAAKKSARRSVLVVDDERLLRWSVAETLSARGYEIAEATDGRTAMQEFGDGDRTDLVLLDLRLPDVSDLRLLARIRQKGPHVPVILMTAFPTREIVEDAAALGASVLIKPFELDQLAASVERALTPRVY
jgi:two-component system, NtrC family, response regulator AtoC